MRHKAKWFWGMASLLIALFVGACRHPCGSWDPESLTVTLPNKTVYNIGDPLELAGLVITASYYDDSTVVITYPHKSLSVSGFDPSSVGEQIITVTYGGKDAAFTVRVNPVESPLPPLRVLESIAVTTLPDNTVYHVGDPDLDLTGLVVTATYNSGPAEIITHDKLEVSGFVSSSDGTKTITVTYGGKNATFTVEVLAVVLEEIEIITPPAKNVYFVGDSGPSLAGIVVKARYNNGDKPTITDSNSGLTTSGFDSSAAGTSTVTVTYGGKSDTFTVKILATVVLSINIIIDPTQNEYFVGDSGPNLAGLVAEASYDNGTTETIDNNNLTPSGFNSSTAGPNTVTVTYGGKNATFTVEILPVVLEEIEIITPPAKNEYFVGDSGPSLAGIVVEARYNNGDTPPITDSDSGLTTSGFDSSTAGPNTVTVTYGGKSDTFGVTVYAPSGITLDENDITITDEGAGLVVFNIQPVVLDRSLGSQHEFIFNEPGCSVIEWRMGNNHLGNANSVTLKAKSFYPGPYTLTLEFTKGGKHWFASLDFTVTE